jgi:trk system potassium uptake protein TrkA
VYIIVVGAGKVGFHLTRALVNGGHEVFVIDSNAKKVADLVESFGAIALKGDGAEPSVLSAAGISRADLLIATTGSDEDNLAACQLAMHAYKVERTISVVNNPENEALFNLLGIDLTVSSTQVILSNIEEELPEGSPIHVLPIRGNREVLRIEILGDTAAGARHLRELDLPPDTTIVALISRDGHLKPLNDETTIEPHDEVIALASADSAEALRELLTERG